MTASTAATSAGPAPHQKWVGARGNSPRRVRPGRDDGDVTLIITFVSGRYIIQASDRRVTYGDGRVGEVMNKGIVIGDSACAAYTGLAFLGGGRHPTDEFVMESVARSMNVDDPDLLERLARDASRTVRMNRDLPKGAQRDEIARTSIVLAGFVPGIDAATGKQRSRRYPILSVVSNAQFDLSEEWAPAARPKFEVQRAWVPDGRWFLHSAGQRIPSTVKRQLIRSLRVAVDRCVHPEPVARLIARAVRDVHEVNDFVGPSVNVVVVRDLVRPADADGKIFGVPIVAPLGPYLLREANHFRGPFGDIKAEPVSSIFLPHPQFPEVSQGPSQVLQGGSMLHSMTFGPKEMSNVAAKATKDLRANRTVSLAVPIKYRRQREPRVLP